MMMNRKKFFSSFGVGIAGLMLIKTLPFKLFKKKKNDKNISVKINPLAVKRENIGGKNA